MLRIAADAAIEANSGVGAARVYIADPPQARTVVVLESLIAIFHAPSGMTHLLAPPAPEILDALADGPADVATILVRLRETHDVTGADAEPAIRARLDELEASGLIRSA